jgi:methylisocitrate lyase
MKKTTMLRELLKGPGCLTIPGAYDCLSARCVEATGFKAVFMTGAGIRDAQLGIPDIGLATASEVINIVKYMANSVTIPLIVDADDGFGDKVTAYRTTQNIIRAGAAGMFISDRAPFILPTAPHGVVEVLTRDEYLDKMGVVLDARNNEDKDFVISARIDAGATIGDEEVVARAKACTELGVDVIMVHFRPAESKFGERDKATLKKLYKKIGAPEVLIWAYGPHNFTAKDYEDVGAKFWVPGRITFVAAEALLNFYQRIHDTGEFPVYTFAPAPEGLGGDNLQKLRGLDFWSELENKKYSLK